MKAIMTIDAKGDWEMTLEGESGPEIAMLEAVKVGYGVHLSTERDDGIISIKGGKE